MKTPQTRLIFIAKETIFKNIEKFAITNNKVSLNQKKNDENTIVILNNPRQLIKYEINRWEFKQKLLNFAVNVSQYFYIFNVLFLSFKK